MTQLRSTLQRFVREVFSDAPKRATAAITLMTTSSLFEGLGITLMFPLLRLLGLSGGSQMDRLSRALSLVLGKVGIGFSIYSVATLLVFMFVLQHALSLLATWLTAGLQVGFTARWRRQLISVLLRVEWLYFTRRKLGEIAHVVNIETQRAASLVQFGAQAVSVSLSCLMYGVVAFTASWKITLILTIGGTLIIAFSQRFVRPPTDTAGQHARLNAQFSGSSAEILSGMKLIRSVDAANIVEAQLWPMIESIRGVERGIWFQPSLLRAGFEISTVTVLMGVLIVARQGLGIDAATVLLVTGLFLRLYPRISTAQQFIHQFRLHLPYYAAIVREFDEAKAAAEPKSRTTGTIINSAAPPSITLEKVSVNYGERSALISVSLTIPARHTVGIVGPSGAGKSTLVDALLRLVPVNEGTIMIDGVPLPDIDVATWRRAVGYVPQDTFLFNTSIRDNIAFANPSASAAEIEAATRKAHLWEFIVSLPHGFETIVGDRGVTLSGGQRQRVGLARALLGDKRLLILDEATSALDSETEAAIMRDIAELHGEVTIIVIAHRLSTVRLADSIVVLEAGHVVEEGSWASLIALGGTFGRLWSMQSAVPNFEGKRADVIASASDSRDE